MKRSGLHSTVSQTS